MRPAGVSPRYAPGGTGAIDMPPEPTPPNQHRRERCQGRVSAERARAALTEEASRGAMLSVGSGGWLSDSNGVIPAVKELCLIPQ